MTNLIPPAAKKKVVFEYWTRVVCAWGVLWSVCILVGAFLLWPTYVLLTGNNSAYASFFSAASERSDEYEELSKQLVVTSLQAKQIVELSNQMKLSDVLSDIWSVTDQDVIEVDKLTIDRDEAGLAPIVISGNASDRKSLAAFRDELQKLEYVTNVELPIKNLAKNEDINFSLQVLVKIEKK